MKGIILAGGSGSRLFPATLAVNKHLLVVYDKPMIFYPMSVLMSAGIQDVLIISTPESIPAFQNLFSDGRELGIRIAYAPQPCPGGLVQAFLIGREFLGGEGAVLILGDNIFLGAGIGDLLAKAAAKRRGATIFCCPAADPKASAVVELGADGAVLTLEEKPSYPRANIVATGLYCYDDQVVNLAAEVRPSARGEVEITDLNLLYLRRKELSAVQLDFEQQWLDAGTPEGMLAAARLVQMREEQGTSVGCLEEIALARGYIGRAQVRERGDRMRQSSYGQHLLRCADPARASAPVRSELSRRPARSYLLD